MVYLPLATSGSFPRGHHSRAWSLWNRRKAEAESVSWNCWLLVTEKACIFIATNRITFKGPPLISLLLMLQRKKKRTPHCWWESRSRQNHRAVRENSEALGCCAGKYLDLRKEIHLNITDRLRRKSGTPASFHCYLLLLKDLLCILSSSLVARQKPYF